VPPNPGTTSALGCLLVDVRHDLFTMMLGDAGSLDPDEVESEFAALEDQARERMKAEGVPDDRVQLQRTIDMRYTGQWRSIAVPVSGRVESLDALRRAFEDEHEREHSYRRESSPVEVYRLNLRAVGVTQKAKLAKHSRSGELPEPVETRSVRFTGAGAQDTPVYRRSDLPAGAELTGPAILEQLDSTVVVPPGVRAEVDEWLNVRMEVGS
jgi:N-methylhydantoinase A